VLRRTRRPDGSTLAGLDARLANAMTQQQFFRPEHFINRELSWLAFNARVLEEAEDPRVPLLERVKFLAIFSSNLDEFFMVRVAGLREQAFGHGAPQDYAADGLTAIEQLERVAKYTQELVARQYKCWNESVQPALAAEGMRLLSYDKLEDAHREAVERFFHDRAFRVLTPMAIDPAHPSPRYHNRGLYLAAMLQRQRGLGPRRLFAVVQAPQVLNRLVPLGEDGGPPFILLEDVLRARLPELFGGSQVMCSTVFRITRDSDFDLLEQESDDMLRLIEERLRARARGEPVRLEVVSSPPEAEELIQTIIDSEEIRVATRSSSYDEVYRIAGPLDLTGLMELVKLRGFNQLRDPPFRPRQLTGRGQRPGEDLFAAVRRHDLLLHHPFDSFDPVVEFVSKAAADPQVLAIKQTLYRTGSDSPITHALIQAAEAGKHVTALVELKARFDEEANVGWARKMERAGVHVVYGFMDLKTHCKLSMVVRQEGSILRRYVHLGTGNYNPQTATVYTDLGIFTVDEEMADDTSALFNLLTGYSQGYNFRRLIVAPLDLRRRVLTLIEEQTERAKQGKPSWIFGKMNALIDPSVIEALYRASQAGVPIDLMVRGICGLRPGLPGISETIRVRSIVDRFLEHSRIFVFSPGDEAQVFLSSADWMPRNFYRRVEVMFPVLAADLKDRVLKEIIPALLRDNSHSRELRADGTYQRLALSDGQMEHRCQFELLDLIPRDASPPPESGEASSNGEPDRPKRKKQKEKAKN
jgi:polyphosphate kinase